MGRGRLPGSGSCRTSRDKEGGKKGAIWAREEKVEAWRWPWVGTRGPGWPRPEPRTRVQGRFPPAPATASCLALPREQPPGKATCPPRGPVRASEGTGQRDPAAARPPRLQGPNLEPEQARWALGAKGPWPPSSSSSQGSALALGPRALLADALCTSAGSFHLQASEAFTAQLN